MEIASSGLYGPGRPANEHAIRIAAARGIDLSRHQSALFDGAGFGPADVALVMDPVHRRRLLREQGIPADRVLVLGDLAARFEGRRAIPDPYGQPDDVFEAVFGRIEECLAAFCSVLVSRRGGP